MTFNVIHLSQDDLIQMLFLTHLCNNLQINCTVSQITINIKYSVKINLTRFLTDMQLCTVLLPLVYYLSFATVFS